MRAELGIFAGLVLATTAGPVYSQATTAGGTATNAAAASAGTNSVAAAKGVPFKVIGYVEKRDRVITILSGPKGTVYSVATREGKVLFENRSLEELKAQAPDIHEFIKTSVAGDARVRPTVKDGGLRRQVWASGEE
jgi:hypothetical protein